MEFAETCPIIVARVSKKKLITEAIDRYQYLEGYIRYEKAIKNDDQIIEIARPYTLECLTSRRDCFYKLKEVGKAFYLLIDRTVQEALKTYPWLAEGRYE
ncbi:hypothetical protein [Leptospira alstonii]|uniref:hypothetical protein n=1 Tax=Leptospira alstonii TaxID=28452 RepID=UPI0007744D74|nr:hypothetical protein [Leptospira alstonii]